MCIHAFRLGIYEYRVATQHKWPSLGIPFRLIAKPVCWGIFIFQYTAAYLYTKLTRERKNMVELYTALHTAMLCIKACSKSAAYIKKMAECALKFRSLWLVPVPVIVALLSVCIFFKVMHCSHLHTKFGIYFLLMLICLTSECTKNKRVHFLLYCLNIKSSIRLNIFMV